jgi:hypothetical protein
LCKKYSETPKIKKCEKIYLPPALSIYYNYSCIKQTRNFGKTNSEGREISKIALLKQNIRKRALQTKYEKVPFLNENENSVI